MSIPHHDQDPPPDHHHLGFTALRVVLNFTIYNPVSAMQAAQLDDSVI